MEVEILLKIHLVEYVCPIEDVTLKVFNMTKGINESKPLLKHISCEYRQGFDERKCNSTQKWNHDKC